MLRNFFFQSDLGSQPQKLSGPLWQASLLALAEAAGPCALGWPRCDHDAALPVQGTVAAAILSASPLS